MEFSESGLEQTNCLSVIVFKSQLIDLDRERFSLRVCSFTPESKRAASSRLPLA